MDTTDWRPDLSAGDGPLHSRVLQALARAVASGALAPGERVPTQRDLAFRLGVGVGTITRAYADAEARGLITSHVGRGSFVAAPRPAASSPPDALIDLAHNIAPAGPAEDRFREAVTRVAKRPDLIENLAYAPPAGLDAHRRAGAAWLTRSAGFGCADWHRLLVCGGAQQALTLVFSILCRPGEVILTEAGSFYGLKGLAAHSGYRLHGVAMDEQGLEPEALAKAVEASGARVLYTLPTFQNPTGRSLGSARRSEIIAVARAYDLTLVEDDIYAAFATNPMPPLASLAPERTFYVSGVSKVLGPGLRTGYVVAPDADRFDALVRATRATLFSPPTLGALIATQWIEDGQADEIAKEVRLEIAARRAVAQSQLTDQVEMGADGSPHIWLPMTELAAERLARRALRAGVEVTPPSAPIIDGDLLSGLRLCLGAAADQPSLSRALGVIASAGEDAGVL